jgi:NADH-quinone oxidoreductase subunit J
MGRLIKIILMFFGLFMAGMVLLAPAVMQALFFLIGTFVVISIYLLLIGAELLSVYYLIVYVGAIMVLFLFVVMMTHHLEVEKSLFSGYRVLMVIFIIFAIILGDFFAKFLYNSDTAHIFSLKLSMCSSYDLLNLSTYGPHYLHLLTTILFEYYGFLVFSIGVLLFITMVGAIRICFPGVMRIPRQDVAIQLERRPSETVTVIDAKAKGKAK